MSISKLFSPKSAASLADAIASVDRDIEAAEATRPNLVAEMDRAVMHDDGVDRAEAAILALDGELRRLSLRRESLARGHAEASAREDRARVAALERAANEATAACAAAASTYNTSARACAAAAAALAEADRRAYLADQAAQRAGGEPAGACYVSHVAEALHLPHSDSGRRPHHARRSVDPFVVALGQQVREVAAAGSREVDRVKSAAVGLLMEAHTKR